MDDHDLGALLDAAVPAATASDEALSRIRRRAAQRRRRAAGLSGALTVAVVAALLLALLAIGSTERSTPKPATMPCASFDVSLTIDPQSSSFNQTTQWAVYAENRSETACRVSAPIKATIHDSNGQILTAVSGTLTAAVLPNEPGYVSALAHNTSTLVGQLVWVLPCSNGPVELEVAGFSRTPARLKLPRQACIVGIDRSRFSMLPVGDTVAGETCPFGSLTFTIDPHVDQQGGSSTWTVTATTRTSVLCRIHAGIEATIEKPDGTVLTDIPGNPARQRDQFQDLFPPSRAMAVGYLEWTSPCSGVPVRLVVRFLDGSYGLPARLTVPRQTCNTSLALPRTHFDVTGPTRKP
jgi:hypothetical protein